MKPYIYTGNNTTPTFTAYFSCNMEAGDYSIKSAGVLDPQSCNFEMFIESVWGCPGMVYQGQGIQLSPGTYFIIFLFAGLLIYFITGWILNCINNGKYGDFVSNMPHLTFWSKLPMLIRAGCIFSKDFLCALCCSKSTHSPIDYDNLDKQ